MPQPNALAATIATLLLLLPNTRLAADETEEGKLVLANENGASVEFVVDDAGWRWARLVTPNLPLGCAVFDHGMEFGAGDESDTLKGSWSLVSQTPNKIVFEQEAPNSGLVLRRAYSFGPARNVLRLETWACSVTGPKLLTHAGLLSLSVAEQAFRTMGPSPASFPVFGQGLFAGIEDICGESRAEGATFHLWQTPDLSVGEEWQLIAAVVVGWHVSRAAPFLPGESRTREAFLQYLDTIRVVPEDINLHSDTWWTLPMPFSEADVLRDVETLRKDFFERTGLFFNTYALDLGWSDPHTLWGIDAQNFPQGFTVINQRLAEMGCKTGLWVSPSSGYAPGLDNQWLEAQGYEMTPTGPEDKVACFAIGGRYQREFTERVLGYAQQYSLGHVIFDGLVHSCDEPNHLHAVGTASVYSIDAGFRDVMNRLRQQNPHIIIEPLSCGHPPSPWWNMHTPFLLGPAGDDVPFGRVPCPDWTESLISARDIAYRRGQENWLVRTQALETFDIIMQSPGTFENLAVMAAGRGRWFMSANIKPELMKATDWEFLAALVRWQRANKQYLVDARMIGGNAEKREAYGYLFHHADRDLYCIRNPWIEERTIRLPAQVEEARDLRMMYPRRGRIGRIEAEDGGIDVVLAPYETMFLETIPAEDAPLTAEPARPAASVNGQPTEQSGEYQAGEMSGVHYFWRGTVSVPAVASGELCVLAEGTAGIEALQATVRIDERAAAVTRKESAGQFGAAVDASPESWTWLLAPISAGQHTVEIDLTIPLSRAGIGLYLRGNVSAPNDPAPDDGAPFPVYQAEQRTWSHTLRSLHVIRREPDAQ